ncbi:MAG: cytochrome B [Euryarchaeota archaeon]|nr:cytochrome B [Euryarchaeota archaeon]|tara:strand:+ start:4230 stop:4820 length:591 start_codon:yes stop_codon:yes gene_type:complete
MEGAHTRAAKFVHWAFVILYAYGIFKQVDDLSQLEDSSLLIFEVIFATVFLAIVIVRYLYMSRFETFLGAREPVPVAHKYLAKAVHSGMYLCLIMLPVTGLLIAGLYTQGYTNEEGLLLGSVLGVHGLAADVSYLLIAVHVGAAIWSRIKGDGVWTSMVPILKETKPSENELVAKLTRLENKLYAKLEHVASQRKK